MYVDESVEKNIEGKDSGYGHYRDRNMELDIL